MHIDAASQRGLREYQEDRYVIHRCENGYLLAVMDGHGGYQVADVCRDYLPIFWDVFVGHPTTTRLRLVIRELDRITADYQTTGSTIAIAFIEHGEGILGELPYVHVAVLGDSLVLISNPAGTIRGGWLTTSISPEHNVRTNLEERDAAIARGGHYEGGYIRKRSGVGLQMSRSLGDGQFGDIISREPEIYSLPFWDWVLLATDGVIDPDHSSGNNQSIAAAIERINAGWDADDLVLNAVDECTEDNATAILYRRTQ